MQYQEEQILSFAQLLNAVEAEQISDDAYCIEYFNHLKQYRHYYIRIYAEVLQRLLQNTQLPAKDIVLMDYGAGNGLLGLFAKHCGFGKVYINDINATFLHSAQQLAMVLKIDIAGFVHGDMDEVRKTLTHNAPNAVVGTDVIEHIYDLDDFFRQIQQMNPAMITVFTTASNTANPFKNRKLMQLQRKDEWEGGEPGDYTLYGNTFTLPFMQIRQNIITEAFPNISNEEVNTLVKYTRGLRKDDILNAVECYIKEKKLPPLLSHPTNTCDPETGSWTERLLTPGEYRSIYAGSGFNCHFYNGFYNAWSGGIKGWVMKAANLGIIAAGKYMAPFITLVGTPKYI